MVYCMLKLLEDSLESESEDISIISALLGATELTVD